MPRGRPVEPETRAQIIADIAEGELSRNAIARKHLVSGSVVTALAADNDLKFDRSKTQAATAAATIDLEAARTDLMKAALQTAADMLDDLRSPTVYNHFEPGGQKTIYDDGKIVSTEFVPGEWREVLADEPTISDKRNLATIFGIMVSRAADLSKASASAGSSAGASFIEDLRLSLIDAAERLAGDADTDPTTTPQDVDRDALLAQFEADNPE